MSDKTYSIIVNNVGWSYGQHVYPGRVYARESDGVPTLELGEDDMELVHEIARGVYDLLVCGGFVNE